MSAVTARDEQAWDAFALAHGGGFLHSWGWAEFQEKLGRTVYRSSIAASRGSGTAAAAQFTLIELPLPFGQRYLYMPWGPLVAGSVAASPRFETVIIALREAMRRDGAAFARVDLPLPADGAVRSSEIAALGFVPAAASAQPDATVLIDLRVGEEALLAGMHSKTRYNIRVAERHGVTVREAALDNAHLRAHDLDVFWSLLATTAERDRFHTHPRSYYETMLDILSAKRREGGCTVRLLFAERNGVALAAGLFARFGDTVTYLHGASLSCERKYMAPYALHWQVMREAAAAGAATYDLWGVAPNDDPEHPWAGITRFKIGFGGRRVRYLGTWELPGNRFWYRLYRFAKALRW